MILCDHAGRALPRALGDLGLPEEALLDHVAWDIGALELSRRLAEAFDAPLVHQTYSRLVIDCNRAPFRPDSIVEVSDRWTVPGNQGLSPAAAHARQAEVFDPYHARIAAELEARAARGIVTTLICVHSFTPVMAGVARPWHVGVLHLGNSPASNATLDLLGREEGLVVGDNEPYEMTDVDYTAPFHAHLRGLDAVELEVRQDLLQDPDTARRIADLLIRLLPEALP